ncbi:hypothetical protein CPB85DRAFT_84634 [Mucidula mucida]|nr:hypothetical protein CPB85DRAFT_84634 [Mucidula mucida]
MPFFLQHPLFTFICYLTFFHHRIWVEAGLVDLTSANRREQVPGLPDWSQAGFERGTQDLPDDSKVGYTLTADQLATQFGLVANDGQDDTDALQKAISAMSQQAVPDGMYRLIQLPAGTINLSYMIYVDTSYLIIRGAGANPDAGGTKLVFRPDEDTKYDTIVNERWDLDNMKYSWDFVDDNGNGVSGEATGGWLWPGRSVFRVGSSEVASKYSRQHSEAPRNRKELFKGSVNYHWRSDEHKIKGWAVSQDNDKAGVKGTSSVRVNRTETKWVTLADETATDVWIASPVKRNDFVSWGVETEDWFVNSYVFQDWATVTSRQTVSDTASIWELDHPLRFDVFRSSIADGSTEMEETEILAKVSPIAHVVHHVGIEHLYITHEIDGLSPSQAERNYGNLAPEQAHHGIVFRYARDSYVRGIRTFMTGSHPIATESARNIQIQDNLFDGAWNKGKGGNGYLRGSRLWDSVIANNTLRNLRHITMQWCAMGNVVILNNITNDMNLHGGYESQNLFELNYASVSYSHRSGSCSSCGGEAGDQEPGTWYPIWWAAGEKASKWSGASGYQNVFYRNYMIKQQVDGGEFLEYLPYFAKDGSLSQKIWQLGWDNQSPAGSRYAHLATESGILKDWNGFEKVDFSVEPNYGANSFLEDPHTSLFLKDVSAATGTIVDFSSIKGYDYCRGDVEPNVVGFYMASSASRSCVPFSPSVIDHTKFTHLVFAYGSLAADGTISVGSSEASLLTEMVALKSTDSKLRISLAIGGWGIGASPSNLVTVATNGGARRRLGTTGAAICSRYGLDGIDLEWAPGISANQFNNIVQDATANLGAFNLSISTPHSFWSSSGINLYAKSIAASVEFISLLTHDSSETTLTALNGPSKMESTLAALHRLEVPRGQILFGVPFYGRSKTPTSQDCVSDGCAINSGTSSTSECIASTDLGQGTFPYYSIYSMDTEGGLDTSAARVGEGMDITSGRYWTSAGDILQFETPDSVREKARQATMLCAGGLSVFSLDQDNRNYDLTNAIWDGGALLPTAAEIVSTLVGEPLDENGLVSGEFWEDVSAQLLQYYANLPVDTMYKVFILIAVWALDEVAGSLYEYLNFSAMTEDSFALYKKWETKALNWAVANYTGMGNDYWQCSYSSSTGNNFKHETCPGGHNTRGADVDDVYWKLTDSSGFATYMTDNLELDTGTMLIGEIPVGRNPSSCGIFRPREARKKAVLRLDMDGWQDDGTGRLLPAIRAPPTASALAAHRSNHRQRDLHSRHHIESMPPYDPSENSEGFSPYDPDKDCRTIWHDPDSRSVDQLMPILQMALTTLVSGNDTLASTMGYSQL